MADDLYGALGALGSGLTAGVNSYREERRLNREDDELAMRKKMLALQMMKEGISEGEGGALSLSPIAEERRRLENDKLKAEAERLRQGDPIANLIKQQKLDEVAKTKTPKGRLEKAGADVKQKLGFITGAFQNLTDYEDNFRAGKRQGYLRQTFPSISGAIGSTPIDDARTNLEESIGRLASGGAISKGEEERFRRMLPTAGDDDEDAQRKLLNLRREMETKFAAYGFKIEELGDLGFDPKSMGYGTEYASMDGRGLLKPKKGLVGGGTAMAGQKIKVSDGKETLFIDPADLADAQKDGFREVR